MEFMVAPKGEFEKVLSDRVGQYFSLRNLSRKADIAMTLKVVLGLMYWAASYVLICIPGLEPASFLFAYVAHGLGHLFIVVSIGHDANHGALSNRAWINRGLSFAMDLVGVNSYMWSLNHHRAHHYCANVPWTR